MSKRKFEEDPGFAPSPASKGAKSEEADEYVDVDLENVYDTLDISLKSRTILLNNEITGFDVLVRKKEELGLTTFPGMNKSTQKKLYKFCLWYEDFRGANDSGADWKDDFDEESLDKIDVSPSKAVLEDDLEKVCKEHSWDTETRLQLARLKITSVDLLYDRKDELELFSLAGLKATTQKALLTFCLWLEDLRKKYQPGVLWQSHFNDASFARYEQEPSVEREYRMALDRLHEGRCDGGIGKVSQHTIDHAATITTRYLSKQLLDQCHKKFNPHEIASKWCWFVASPNRQSHWKNIFGRRENAVRKKHRQGGVRCSPSPTFLFPYHHYERGTRKRRPQGNFEFELAELLPFSFC